MSGARPYHGSLFAEDFLRGSISELPDWETVTEATLDDVEAELRDVFSRFPVAASPNESQTEDDLIWPVLRTLGWTSSLRQQNLSARGRDDVPDGLLFEDDAVKDHANSFFEEWKRYARRSGDRGVQAMGSPYGFRGWWAVAQSTVGSPGVAVCPPAFDDNLSFAQRVEDLSV